MAMRCPGSTYLFSGKLVGYKWIIYSRGYANIVPSEKDYVLGEIFHLSERDEEALDVYESVAQGMYTKEEIEIITSEGFISCMVYIDPIQETGQPKSEYIHRINQGLVSASLCPNYVRKYIRPFVKE
jgi:gamma-glutamylcyclotransferase (GGCT)/AIG2-like uncharacterized protein YtfP